MAKQYYAATKIKFGKRTENDTAEGKYESKVFEPGDKVTGLDVEDMKGLWNAGASSGLYRRVRRRSDKPQL